MQSGKTTKKLLIAAGVLAVSFSAAAMIHRATETEYTYFDAQGHWVGSLTYPCEGRVIRVGNTTNYASFTETSFSCDLAGPDPDPNQPPFPWPN